MAALDDAVARLADEPADHRFKGLPPDAAVSGTTLGGLAAERRSLFTGGFTSPVLALSAERLEHNLATLAGHAARHGLTFAPHSKTHMAPQLIARQLAGGAWGVTLAVPHQVRVARAFGVQRILLANELVDAAALRWLMRRAGQRPGLPLCLLCRLTARRLAHGRGPARGGRAAPARRGGGAGRG